MEKKKNEKAAVGTAAGGEKRRGKREFLSRDMRGKTREQIVCQISASSLL